MTDRRKAALTAAALAAWALLLVAAWLLGQYKVAITEKSLKLGAMPLFGRWEWHFEPRLLVPVAVGALIIAVLPAIARDRRWRLAVAATALAGIAMSLALAYAHSHPGTWEDLHHHYGDPIHFVDDAGGVRPFLETYTDIQRTGAFPIHLQSHPPGLVLFLWAAAQIGLKGVLFENTVTMLAVAAAIVAALAIARDVAGERLARRAAPFLVVAPAAFWHTNADIVFGGVTLTALACLILATGREGPKAVWLTVVGGLLAGAALMLSFSMVLLAIPLVVVALRRRRWIVLAAGGALAALVVLTPLVWGYWWLDGLQATRERYYHGVASVRGYWYFLIGNPAVFALALGPATAVALARLRDRRMWIVVGSCLAAVALAALSGMSSAETERIWQPFMPLVLLAGCALNRPRAWLALQLAVAVVLAAALRVQW
ncbi:glycosyltransferase family 39 protein [Glycomyces sp. L485]|uniref:glycosyltransferase family 39 protein n=1 Tax=Glycomyces sp. L485 TaxID=2909235 RepID=UPI001F4B47FA|nr:glycosyltransferase family 39 protein [Glycomyces sp. L485]MCH7232296.1 glycosyltransferase family 39 protein [Glycomyces sp. L485]